MPLFPPFFVSFVVGFFSSVAVFSSRWPPLKLLLSSSDLPGALIGGNQLRRVFLFGAVLFFQQTMSPLVSLKITNTLFHLLRCQGVLQKCSQNGFQTPVSPFSPFR